MAVWLVRAGSRLPRHDFALDKNVVVAGWDEMPDLSKFTTREQLETACKQAYPTRRPNAIRNWSRQLWAFAKTIQNGDLAIMPIRGQNVLAIGRVTGGYEYNPENPTGALLRASITKSVRSIGRNKRRFNFGFRRSKAQTRTTISRCRTYLG